MNMAERKDSPLFGVWTPLKEPTAVDLDPVTTDQLIAQFTQDGPQDFEGEYQIAESIYRKNFALKFYPDAIQTYFDVCNTLNNIHFQVGRNHHPHSSRAMNDIWGQLAMRLAMDHARNVPEDYLSKLNQVSVRLESKKDFDGWFGPKALTLVSEISKWKEIYKWLAIVKPRLEFATERVTVEELKADADLVFQRTFENQRYGVKPCYFSSSIFNASPDDAITIYDQNFGLGQESGPDRLVDFTAAISLGEKPKREPKGRRISQHRELAYGDVLEPNYIVVENSFALWMITKDGEILESPTGNLSIERVFKKLGMEKGYQYFRLLMGMRLHDLVTRAELTDRLPSIADFEEEIVRLSERKARGRKPRKPDYKRLLLPRISEAAEGENYEGQRRFMDRHKVVWFIRRLPVGYHASQTSIEYAKGCGVSLDDGETIVREHYRGQRNPEKELPHRARFTTPN